MRLGTILFLAMAGTASAQTTQPTTIHVTTSAEFEKLPKVLRGGETVRLAKGEFLTKNGLRLDNRSGLTVTIEGDPGGGTIVRASGAGKAVFDPAPGSGNYVFRNLRITGGYAWRFHPPLPADLTPERAADLAAYAWRGDAEWAEVVACLTADQIHDVLIEDCEVDGAALGAVQSGIYARNAGVRNLIVRRTKFHHTVGTEGTVDIGEWKDFKGVRNRLADIPGSASRDLLFEDCEFVNPQHNRSCGIVTQPCTGDVTLRRCRSRNAAQYCFGLKSSGRVVLEECEAVGGDNGGIYCRGFGGIEGSDSGGTRPVHRATFELVRCIAIAPADSRGGAALLWRENCDLTVRESTIVGLRHTADHDDDGVEDRPGGGYAVVSYPHDIPCTLTIERSIIAGCNESSVLRMVQTENATFCGRGNLYGPAETTTTRFTWQKKNTRDLNVWRSSCGSDDTSRLAELPWQHDWTQTPLARMWPANWRDEIPIRRPCVCECD